MDDDFSLRPYADRAGSSGVAAYALGPAGIAVQFTDGSVYVYTHERPGAAAVAEMTRLARAGEGLNGYINRFVRDEYAQRLR